MTKSTQRAHHASKPKSATRQRKNEARTSEPLKASKAEEGIPVTDHEPIDVTPEQFFKAWSRKDRAALIEVLIDSLDAEAGDPDIEDAGDAEPSLASLENHPSIPETRRKVAHRDYSGDQSNWAGGASNDCEVDDGDDEPSIGFDERELDDADDPKGEEVNEDGDGNPDDEYSLGWHNESAQRGNGWFNIHCVDREECVPVVTAAARQRYKPFDRYNTNRDGMHVDAERGYAVGSRRLRNLSDQQRAAVARRLNRDEVRI